MSISKSHLILSAGRLHYRIEVGLLSWTHIIIHKLEVNLRSFRVEEVFEDLIERLILRNLRQHQAGQSVAHDEIIGFGDFGELSIADVQYLTDYRTVLASALNDIAQVQKGDQRSRIGFLWFQRV